MPMPMMLRTKKRTYSRRYDVRPRSRKVQKRLPKYANVVAAVTEMTFAVNGLDANMLLSATSRRLNKPTSITNAMSPMTPNFAASARTFSNLTRKTATVVAMRPRGVGCAEIWLMFLGYPPHASISGDVR